MTLDVDNEDFTLQACLKELKKCEDENTRYNMVKNNENLFKKEIDINDTGMDEGICGEVNNRCFAKLSVEKCMQIFKQEMRDMNIRFI